MLTIKKVGAAAIPEDEGERLGFKVTHWGGKRPVQGREWDTYAVGTLHFEGSATRGEWAIWPDPDQDYHVDNGYFGSSPPKWDPLSLGLYRAVKSQTLYIYPTADGVIEPDETVKGTLTPVTVFTVEPFRDEVVFTIENDDSPAIVEITADNPIVKERTDKISQPLPIVSSPLWVSFTVTRSGSTDYDLRVPLSFEGSAQAGLDYHSEPVGYVTIPAGWSWTSFSLLIAPDTVVEPAETLVARILPTDYVTPHPRKSSAAVLILDDDTIPARWELVREPPRTPTEYGAWKFHAASKTWTRRKVVYQWELADANEPFLATGENQPIDERYEMFLQAPVDYNFGVDVVLHASASYSYNAIDGFNPKSYIVHEAAPGAGWALGLQWRVERSYGIAQIIYDEYGASHTTPLGLSTTAIDGPAGDAYVDATQVVTGYHSVGMATYKRRTAP